MYVLYLGRRGWSHEVEAGTTKKLLEGLPTASDAATCSLAHQSQDERDSVCEAELPGFTVYISHREAA